MTTVAFLTTAPYQLHHYAAVSRHLDARQVTYLIERRTSDFQLTPHDVEAVAPGAQIDETTYERLEEIDGRYDVVVCQTPVLPNRLLKKSAVVAQQYSLAKTNYQLGVWRSLCTLNLMYGAHSTSRVEGFAVARAVGNPLFDDRSTFTAPDTGAPGLYLPTYGSLSSSSETFARLAEIDAEFVVRLHHATVADNPPALPPNCVLASPERHPMDLIAESSFVISDCSGAGYDAVGAFRPLVLVSSPDTGDEAVHRLGRDERTSSPLTEFGAEWHLGRPLDDAVDEARGLAERSGVHEQFVERYYTNFGEAGPAAAEAIVGSVDTSWSMSFGHEVVRDHVAKSLAEKRHLADDNRRLRHANTKLRTRRQEVTSKLANRWSDRARSQLQRQPRLHRAMHTLRRTIQR